jgi:GT2 family glycosyltransferase
MKISVVLPNYNGLNLLKKNFSVLVEILRKESYQYELIVVDDASDDSSAEWLRDWILENDENNIKIIVNSKNHGFSYTANRGAQVSSGDYIVFLNTDVVPKNNFIKNSLNHFKDSTVFAVGFMDESREDDSVILRGRAIGWWSKGLYFHKRASVDSNDTAWVSAGSGIFRRSMFEELHGFDEIFDPFYWEDIDLSYRAKMKGYKLIFEPRSIVVHEHQKGAILIKYSRSEIKKISYRNQFLFVWKNVSLSQLTAHIVWLPYHIGKAILRKDREFIKGFLWATARFIRKKFLSL